MVTGRPICCFLRRLCRAHWTGRTGQPLALRRQDSRRRPLRRRAHRHWLNIAYALSVPVRAWHWVSLLCSPASALAFSLVSSTSAGVSHLPWHSRSASRCRLLAVSHVDKVTGGLSQRYGKPFWSVTLNPKARAFFRRRLATVRNPLSQRFCGVLRRFSCWAQLQAALGAARVVLVQRCHTLCNRERMLSVRFATLAEPHFRRCAGRPGSAVGSPRAVGPASAPVLEWRRLTLRCTRRSTAGFAVCHPHCSNVGRSARSSVQPALRQSLRRSSSPFGAAELKRSRALEPGSSAPWV